MKKIVVLLLIVLVAGCKLRPGGGVINTAAGHFSSVCIMENIPSIPTLRIQGSPTVQTSGQDIYHVTGLLEGYSSYNTPVSVEHFSGNLLYLGGNPDDRKSWECMDMYVGKKKIN